MLWACPCVSVGGAVSAGNPGLEPCLVPSALCALGPRICSTAVPHTPLSTDSGPGDPREGSDLHEAFLSALPGGERVRKALYRPLTCGLKIRPPHSAQVTGSGKEGDCSEWPRAISCLFLRTPCGQSPETHPCVYALLWRWVLGPVCMETGSRRSHHCPGNSEDAGARYVGW